MAAMLAFIVCAIAAAMAPTDAAIAATGTIPRSVTPPVIPVIVVIPVIAIVMIVVTVMVPIIVLRVLRTSAGFTRTAAVLGNVRGDAPSCAAIERGRVHAGGQFGRCGC